MNCSHLTTDELKSLDDGIHDCIERLKNLRFDKEDFRHQVVVGLALSVLERSHAVLLLLKEGKSFDSEILFRSLLEHYVELKNCIQDSGYHHHFQKPFLTGLKGTLREAKEGNPFLNLISQNIDVDEELEIVDQRITEVEATGSKTLNSQAKFHRAGMKHEYESIFRSTSEQVHPTYSGIIKRHFNINHESNSFEVQAFSRSSRTSEEPILHTTLEIIESQIQLIDLFQREIDEFEDE